MVKKKDQKEGKRMIPLRAAGEKISTGIERPSQRLFAEVKRQLQSEDEQPTSPTLPTLPTAATVTTRAVEKIPVAALPVSPEKDFSKVANSIVRALPEGLFIGKSKQIYDFIYSVTRAAIKPTRSIRLTKPQLMKGSDCRAEKSLMRNIAHLKSVGLLKVIVFNGEHGGNEYEIFLPEETDIAIDLPYLPDLPTYGSYQPEKVETLPTGESSVGSVAQSVENKDGSDSAKTILKTRDKNDDEKTRAFSSFIEKFSELSAKITGREPSGKDREKWAMLADLLILEFETAARKTNAISSVPSFLTEVLRRKLLRGYAPPVAKAKLDLIGKPGDAGEYKIKPLDESGRLEAVAQLAEFAGDDFLGDFKKWYTDEDWQWITEELKNQPR